MLTYHLRNSLVNNNDEILASVNVVVTCAMIDRYVELFSKRAGYMHKKKKKKQQQKVKMSFCNYFKVVVVYW